jgi:hypothetical protein
MNSTLAPDRFEVVYGKLGKLGGISLLPIREIRRNSWFHFFSAIGPSESLAPRVCIRELDDLSFRC